MSAPVASVRALAVAAALVSLTTVGCEKPVPPTPSAPAPAIPVPVPPAAEAPGAAPAELPSPTDAGPTAAPSAPSAAAQPPAPTTDAGSGAPQPTTPAPVQLTGAGAALYSARCSMCHGPRGEGNGPASAAIRVKMQNLGDPAWQGQVTDDYLRKIIAGGGPAVGKNAAMPPAPDIVKDPRFPELIAFIRSLKK